PCRPTMVLILLVACTSESTSLSPDSVSISARIADAQADASPNTGTSTAGEAPTTQKGGPAKPATALAIVTQPSASATSGIAFAHQPGVQLRDVSKHDVNEAGVIVVATIASGGGTLGGATTAVTDTSGVASFTNLSITGPGSYTLRFSATGLTSAS